MYHYWIGMLFSNTAASRAAGWQRKWKSPSGGHCYLTQRNSPLSCDFYGVFFFSSFCRIVTIQDWMLLGVCAITRIQAWGLSYRKGFTCSHSGTWSRYALGKLCLCLCFSKSSPSGAGYLRSTDFLRRLS